MFELWTTQVQTGRIRKHGHGFVVGKSSKYKLMHGDYIYMLFVFTHRHVDTHVDTHLRPYASTESCMEMYT